MSDVSRLPDISSFNVEKVLPSNHDLEALKDNITVLVCCTARKYLPFFQKHIDSKGVPQHIIHKYTAEMSLKSIPYRLCLITCMFIVVLTFCLLCMLFDDRFH